MKPFIYLIIIPIYLIMHTTVLGFPLTAEEILRNVDDFRLVSDSFEMVIRIDNLLNDRDEGPTIINGRVDHGKLTSLTFLEPSNMKDRKIVINDEGMKLIIPKVRNAIRITPSQRLVGGISYGDVAAIGYGDEYTPKLIGEEQIIGINSDGTKSDLIGCFVLELCAKQKSANYSKAILWVEKQNYLPVKGDFFALSGKKMTTVYYTAPKKWRGKTIITKLFLYDQINIGKSFSMEYSGFKIN